MKSKTASLPYIIWMIIFYCCPDDSGCVFAFTDKSGQFTLENIAKVGQYSNVFLRSIWMGALATLISDPGISAGLYYRAHARTPAECHDYAGDAADVDELFAADLCLDDAFRGQRPN